MTTKITEQNISQLANAGVNWQSVFTGDGSTGLTAVAGRGYFIDTTSGTVEVTLPASPSAGDVVVLKDYARTWGTNYVTLASALMDGATETNTFSTTGQTVTLVYMDGTKGWSLINEDTTSILEASPTFTAATGGTVTTSGDYKIHTFTGDSIFVVSSVGNASIIPTGGPSVVDYLVVAGGGGASGGPGNYAAGGGAGGFRESSGTASGCYSASPLGACVSGITVSTTTYPVTVGAGGAGVCGEATPGNPGSTSSFSTITSTGGGNGAPGNPAPSGLPGGSGGGGAANPGLGNTPPVSPPQGNNGGTQAGAPPHFGRGGGGGATAAGQNGTTNGGGDGGAGATTSISGSPTSYAGGGGGGLFNAPGPEGGGTGGLGGGGNGSPNSPTPAQDGTANTGGGAGGQSLSPGDNPSGSGKSGGKGIVIIRYKFQ